MVLEESLQAKYQERGYGLARIFFFITILNDKILEVYLTHERYIFRTCYRTIITRVFTMCSVPSEISQDCMFTFIAPRCEPPGADGS